MQSGDVVAELGGSPVQDADELQARLRGYPAKAAIPLVLWRDGRKIPLTLTPVEFSAQQMDALAWDRLGLKLVPSRGTLAVSSVRPGSQAEGFGIERGDLDRPAEQRRAGLGGDVPGGARLGPERTLGSCWWCAVGVGTTS